VAHATDYQSRLDKPLNMRSVLKSLVANVATLYPHYTEQQRKDYALLCYSSLGLTERLYDELVKK
jgi:hypothetical protein